MSLKPQLIQSLVLILICAVSSITAFRKRDEVFHNGSLQPAADWWADVAGHYYEKAKDYDKDYLPLTFMSRPLDVVSHIHKKGEKPWEMLSQGGATEKLYEQMGMADSSRRYVAVWISFGDEKSVAMLSEVSDNTKFDALMSDPDLLKTRLKLIIRGPFPAKGPRSATTIEKYFGKQAIYQNSSTSSKGVQYSVFHVNVHADFAVRWAWKLLRKDTEVDFFVIDWAGQGILSGVHLKCTQEALKFLT